MALFLPTLKHRGQLDSTHMTLCSVGSRKNNAQNDFGSQAWGLFAPNLAIYGFDADADACDAANNDLANRQINWTEEHFPCAIASQDGEATLYVTQDPQCSSLYPPNERFLRRFDGIRDLVQLEFTVELETTTLDHALNAQGISAIDFCQIDVQGANLQVLQGANDLLAHSLLGIQVEVEFTPLYLNQPLFADVDQFLRDRGFVLFDLAMARRPRGIVHSVYHPGQLLWADAFYFRDPLQAPEGAFWTQPDHIFKLACIADALDFTDYALELLEHLTVQYGPQADYNFADAIAASLQEIPELVEVGLEKLLIIQNLMPFLTEPLPTSGH
ncbi:MAG: FkbM family methyltransferase [Leptolyngbyaceae cyanobacterium bins.349]|nr:FkbM family methyltransferase [Leptolyngbyaceae cyanobacterium bins.349]